MRFASFIPRRRVGPRKLVVSRVVGQALQAGLTNFQPAVMMGPNEALHRACRRALENLWDRRDALARSLLTPLEPISTAAPMARPRAPRVPPLHDRRIVELNDATERCASILGAALQAARVPRAPWDGPQAQRWPFSPQCWAMTLRRIVELASPVHEVRLELLRLGTSLLCRHIVDSWRHAALDADSREPGGDAPVGQDSTSKETWMLRHRVPPLRGGESEGRLTGRRVLGIAWLCLSACLVALLMGCGGGGATAPATPGGSASAQLPGTTPAVPVVVARDTNHGA